ncbi:MAG: tyrosine-protein phosphatase [Calditrichia bacterium]
METFIDIHNHLIPDFDDGPRTMQESLEMLRIAADQGITEVFATSHFSEYIPPEQEQDYFYKLQDLREAALARHIPVTIYSGAEIFYHHYIEDTVKANRVGTLGEFGQYVLMEFPMFQHPSGAEEALFQLSASNYIPILAHPERYSLLLEKPEKAQEFIKYGAFIQLNGGSVLGHFGRQVQKVALELLEKRQVHFIASDAHTPNDRSFVLKDVFNFLKDTLPSDYLQDLLYANPRKIIDQVRIERPEIPPEIQQEGFFNTLKKFFKL